MQLNSILFPAPKCSYSIDTLKGQLIWIPKYQRVSHSLVRFQTQPFEDKHYKSQIYANEFKKHSIPLAKSKKTMPKTPTLDSKENSLRQSYNKTPCSTVTKFDYNPNKKQSKSGSKSSAIKNKKNRFLFVPENKPTPVDHQASFLDMSDMIDEPRDPREGTQQLFEEIDFKLLKDSKKINESPPSSAEISFSVDDVPQGFLQQNTEKRFFKNSQISNKNSKASTAATNDHSLTQETDFLPVAHEKKPSLRIDKITLCTDIKRDCPGPHMQRITKSTKPIRSQTLKPERQITIDTESVEEYPDDAQEVSSPKMFHMYKTKCLPRHNVGSEKIFMAARMLSREYEMLYRSNGGSKTSRNQEKVKIDFNKFSSPHEQIEYYIPCLFLKASIDTNNIMVYFHGNGEDVNLSYSLLSHVRDRLDVRIS
jgi:hypothetical protein